MGLRRAALIGTLVAMWACAMPGQDTSGASGLVGPSPAVKPDPAGQMPLPAAAPEIRGTASANELGGLATLAGIRVHDVQFRSPAIQDAERLRALLPQQPGEPLDKLKLRRSIQALFATGRFANIQVEAEPAPDHQLSLVFVAEENYFVGQVTLSGAPRSGPNDHQLINAGKLQLGELYSEEKLRQSLDNMKRVLEDGGYYQATIGNVVLRHPETQQIDITFQVHPGEQARVGRITVTGSPGYSVEEIGKITDFAPGQTATLAHVNRALQRLRKKYQKQERLEAQVSITQRSYHPASNTVDYVFNIVRGPTVDIRVQGAKLGRGMLKKLVPVYEENAVDNDLLNEGRRNLRNYYQSRGYFDVDVTYRQEADPGNEQLDLLYMVERGERHQLVTILLQGNKYFPDDIIRDRMTIQPAGWLLSYGLFSSDMLSRDVQSIQDLYKSNGFQQVSVTSEVKDDYQGIQGHLGVLLHIKEGPQTRVSSLKLAGVTAFPQSQILDLLSTIQGQPFSDVNVATDRDAITSFYFNHGFPEVDFESAATPLPGDPTRVDVTYTIHEGERVFVNRVLIGGLNFTRPYVVDRKVEVHASDPLNQAAMLDTQRRLYDLGIFNAVDVAVQNPEGDENYKNVLLNVYEAQRYTIDYGLGFEVQTGAPYTQTPQGRTGASPRVSFDITRTNFRGTDHTIYFKSHVGRLQQRALLSYEAPSWFDREDLKLTLTALYDNTRDVTTFTSSRLEGSVQAEQRWSKATTIMYRFSYRLVKVDPRTLVIDPNLIPLLSRPERIGMPSLTFVHDTRDDPLESHKGRYIAVDTGISAKVFGSEASFGRFLVQHSAYKSFHQTRPNCENCYVLAFSTRMGFEPPFGAPGALVPLPERFLAGGGNSLRGFGINQAGPRDHETGFPVGGESMFINNIELRFPPVPLPYFGNSLSPVVFHDMGNVFASTGDLFPSLFRVTQKNREQCQLVTITSTCDFNYLSHAIGGGIRYKTPIGPVRLDVGYNLNPPVFPIRSQSTFETLHRWNFFFSIGQTF